MPGTLFFFGDIIVSMSTLNLHFLFVSNRMHWVLCAIDPFNNIVYYFDSLHNEEEIGTGKGVSEDLREIIDVYVLFSYQL